MRPGTRIGVDVGRVRVGVARSDREGLLATPVETMPRDTKTIEALSQLVNELQPIEIIVGLPLSLSGNDTASTTDARSFARELAQAAAIPVRLVDERLSTVSAERQLKANGRSTKNARDVIDQAAAVIILQNALDFERTAVRPPGALVDL